MFIPLCVPIQTRASHGEDQDAPLCFIGGFDTETKEEALERVTLAFREYRYAKEIEFGGESPEKLYLIEKRESWERVGGESEWRRDWTTRLLTSVSGKVTLIIRLTDKKGRLIEQNLMVIHHLLRNEKNEPHAAKKERLTFFKRIVRWITNSN